jgi:anti-sigma regulatory factor (Ser/Thr protein kinase)
LLLMSWDAKTAQRGPAAQDAAQDAAQEAAQEALTGPPSPQPGGGGPLPPPAPGAMSYTYTTDLAAIRAVVYRYAREAGLPEQRAIDLVLAVSEVAANTIRHAKSAGSLKIWYDSEEIVCQIEDDGLISDPLAGRRQPSLDAMGGHGLWIVRQVCDEVDMHSDETGTTIRLHMKLPGRQAR